MTIKIKILDIDLNPNNLSIQTYHQKWSYNIEKNALPAAKKMYFHQNQYKGNAVLTQVKRDNEKNTKNKES